MLEATFVILNANVITLDIRQPRANAIAIQGSTIIEVGSNEKVRRHIGRKTKVIDAKNKTVVPGFVDCHAHMLDFGFSLQAVDLRDVKSIEELQRKLHDYDRKNPDNSWILGGRWDHERFVERRYPTRYDLDIAVPDRPVFLVRVCGHVAVVNSKALLLAGIGRDTAVEGGHISLDEKTKQPSGILRENALELVQRVVPKPAHKDVEEACLRACEEAVKVGLTGVHWLVTSMDELRALQKLSSRGKLPLRLYLGVPAKMLSAVVEPGLMTGFGNNMLKVGFVKVFADGSLGGHSAALSKPYSDKPETRGVMIVSQKKLDELVLKVHEARLQLGVHAIGDRAIESVLKAVGKALRKIPRENHRHRIEHCSVLNPRLIRLVKRLGVIASVQPHFLVSDFWIFGRIGEKRARWAYPFRTLIKSGVMVISGSDCPVEKIDPLLGISAAVNRVNFPEESLTMEDALKTYTLNAAYASFDEVRKGTIERGRFADLTVLSDDLLEIPANKFPKVSVEMTIIDGRVVYASGNFRRHLD